MKTLKKAARMLFLVLMLLLALSGIGATGNLFNRERYRDKEIRIERIDKRDNEEEEEKETE